MLQVRERGRSHHFFKKPLPVLDLCFVTYRPKDFKIFNHSIILFESLSTHISHTVLLYPNQFQTLNINL